MYQYLRDMVTMIKKSVIKLVIAKIFERSNLREANDSFIFDDILNISLFLSDNFHQCR